MSDPFDAAAAGAAGPLPLALAEVPAVPAPAAEPLREDQIQNAVSFLTHPKVRESPAATKRSFLQRKGLTEPEIDEAFRRAPDLPADPIAAAPSAAATASPVPGPQGSGLITYVPQRTPAAQGAAPAASTQLAVVPHIAAPQPLVQAPPPPQPIRWTQVVLGLGVVAASVYAVHTVVTPYLSRLYNGWSESVRARQEEQERQRQEAKETMEALRKMQDQLVVATESMAEAARAIKEQMARADDTRQVLAGLTEAVRGLKQQQDPRGPPRANGGGYQSDSWRQYEQYSGMGSGYGGGGTVNGSYGGGDVRAPPGGWLGGYGAPAPSSAAPGGSFQAAPNSAGAWAAAEAAGSPVRPGSSGNSLSAGRPYFPDDGGFSAYAASAGPVTPQPLGPAPGASLPARQPAPAVWPAPAGNGPAGPENPVAAAAAADPSRAGGEPAYPKSFQEVMDMVSKGITPPNVRTDINDKPPDPSRMPTQPRVQPRPKPWERSGGPDALPGSSADAVLPAASAAGWSAMPPAAATTLSVLQPLAASGSTWQPPALPAPTIPRLAAAAAAAAGNSSSSSPSVAGASAAQPLTGDGPGVAAAPLVAPSPEPAAAAPQVVPAAVAVVEEPADQAQA